MHKRNELLEEAEKVSMQSCDKLREFDVMLKDIHEYLL